MAETRLNMQILLRRAEFADTCVLAAGEPGYHTGTKELKIGDGTSTWAQLGFANQTQIEALIKVVDDKVAALGDTYATDEEVKVIKEALQAAIDTKLAAETFNTYSAARQLTDTEINTAVGNVDAKFASYRTSADQDVIDNGIKGRLDTLEAKPFDTYATKSEVQAVADDVTEINTELETFGDIVTHDVAEFATAAQGAKADAAAVKTEVDAALLLKADKSVVDAMYTNAQIDGFIADAKKYADDNDADTKYGIAYDSDSKKITLVEGGTNFEIDATDFIKDGMIDTVTIGDDNDLVITFNTAAGKDEIRLPLDQLVDIYTGSTGDRVVVTVASDKSISAELVAGSISKNYLDTAVQTSLGLADSALQAADLADYAKTADVVTNEEFTAFEATNSEAIAAAKKAGEDAAAAVAEDLAEYIDGKSMSDAELKKYAEDEADAAESTAKAYTDTKTQGYTFDKGNITIKTSRDTASLRLNNQEGEVELYGQTIIIGTPDSIDDREIRIGQGDSLEDLPASTIYLGDKLVIDTDGNAYYYNPNTNPENKKQYLATENYAEDAAAQALADAKAYADEKEHKDTTYTAAATANALEFTLTPSVGEAQTVTLVAPTVDTGVMAVIAAENDDITATTDGSTVTVAHKAYQTGTIKAAEGTEEPNFLTSVTIANGHVTGASVQTLSAALTSMTFILDGGTSAN